MNKWISSWFKRALRVVCVQPCSIISTISGDCATRIKCIINIFTFVNCCSTYMGWWPHHISIFHLKATWSRYTVETSIICTVFLIKNAHKIKLMKVAISCYQILTQSYIQYSSDVTLHSLSSNLLTLLSDLLTLV